MTTMDWSDPAAVKRYQRRTILKLVGLPVLFGLLAAAALLVYERSHPLSEQQRQRVRDRIKANLNRPVTTGDLLLILVILLGVVSVGLTFFAMLMLGLH